MSLLILSCEPRSPEGSTSPGRRLPASKRERRVSGSLHHEMLRRCPRCRNVLARKQSITGIPRVESVKDLKFIGFAKTTILSIPAEVEESLKNCNWTQMAALRIPIVRHLGQLEEQLHGRRRRRRRRRRHRRHSQGHASTLKVTAGSVHQNSMDLAPRQDLLLRRFASRR